MQLACRFQQRLRSRLFSSSLSHHLINRHLNYSQHIPSVSLGCTGRLQLSFSSSSAFVSPIETTPSSNQNFLRFFTAQAADETSPSSISFEPHEVSRELVELAKKYCKEGTDVSAAAKFESLQTREERQWDCLDTVEFVLDAEDIYGIVIPDEDADSFESIQDVVDFIVKTGKSKAAEKKS